MAEMTLAAVARALNARADQPGVFSGYASLFGTVDSQGDLVERGAFRPSLEAWRAKGRRPAMLWQHDHAEPIGLWTGIEEDATGLKVEGRLLLSVRAGAEAYEHIKAGTVADRSADCHGRKGDRLALRHLPTICAVQGRDKLRPLNGAYHSPDLVPSSSTSRRRRSAPGR